MRYYSTIIKEGSRQSIGDYDEKEKAEKRLRKYTDKKYDAQVISVPEIQVGLELFRRGTYYKTIIGETRKLWFINNLEDPEAIHDVISKDRILNWFISGYLDGMESYDYSSTELFYHNDGQEDDEELNINESAVEGEN